MRSDTRPAGRSAVVAGLLLSDVSPLRLASAAAVPVLVAVWLLIRPGWILSREMTWDFLFNLSGAWHVQQGYQPHVDFHDPLGSLGFRLTALGFRLTGFTPYAFLAGELMVMTWMFAAAVVAAARRLPLLPAVLFVMYAVLLVLRPANVGDHPAAYSFAMSYNRWCWSALMTLFLILFVEPRRDRMAAWIDPLTSALLVVFMFYLKITFAAAGVMAVILGMLVTAHIRGAWRAWLGAVTAIIVVIALPTNYPYLIDVWRAARTGYVRASSSQVFVLLENRAEFALYGSALLMLVWLWQRGWAQLSTVLAGGAILALGTFALSQNAQTSVIPVGIVIPLLAYETLRRRGEQPGLSPRGDGAWALVALLLWPSASVASELATLAGYSRAAGRGTDVVRVETGPLRGLAVPTDDDQVADGFRALGQELWSNARTMPVRDAVTQQEYLQTLSRAADLFPEPRGDVRILVFDHVNPLPFILGIPPPRGGNLWLWPEDPAWSAAEVFGDVNVVLVPKRSADPATTLFALTTYGRYLRSAFPNRSETPDWTILRRNGDVPAR